MDRRKRELKKAAERKSLRQSLPLSPDAFRELFGVIDQKVPTEGCDHSLRWTMAWLKRRKLDPAPVIAWLNDHGGYCDCEVLNAQDTVEEATKDDA